MSTASWERGRGRRAWGWGVMNMLGIVMNTPLDEIINGRTHLRTFLVQVSGKSTQLSLSEDFLKSHPECAEVLAEVCLKTSANAVAAAHFIAVHLLLNKSPPSSALKHAVYRALSDRFQRLSWLDGSFQQLADATSIIKRADEMAGLEFSNGNMVAADDALQVRHELLNPFVMPLPTLHDMLMDVETHQNPARSSFSTDADFIPVYSDHETPNRIEFAKLVAGVLPSDGVCLEIGCYDGAVLAAIGNEVRVRGDGCVLFGVEPTKSAVAYAKVYRPELRVVQGSAAELAGGSLDAQIPINIDVVCFSGVCQLLPTDELFNIFLWARDHCQAIVIADDVVNWNGRCAVARGIYTLHPFEKLLMEAGFVISYLALVPETTRAYSGYIVARQSMVRT